MPWKPPKLAKLPPRLQRKELTPDVLAQFKAQALHIDDVHGVNITASPHLRLLDGGAERVKAAQLLQNLRIVVGTDVLTLKTMALSQKAKAALRARVDAFASLHDHIAKFLTDYEKKFRGGKAL